jgi:hypothetical protein
MTLMTLSAAAAQLENNLRSHPWYHSIAEGQSENGETIFLCVKSHVRHAPLLELNEGYRGFTVQIRMLTPPRFVVHGDLCFIGVPDEDDNQPSSYSERSARSAGSGESPRRPSWESRKNRSPSSHRRPPSGTTQVQRTAAA